MSRRLLACLLSLLLLLALLPAAAFATQIDRTLPVNPSSSAIPLDAAPRVGDFVQFSLPTGYTGSIIAYKVYKDRDQHSVTVDAPVMQLPIMARYGNIYNVQIDYTLDFAYTFYLNGSADAASLAVYRCMDGKQFDSVRMFFRMSDGVYCKALTKISYTTFDDLSQALGSMGGRHVYATETLVSDSLPVPDLTTATGTVSETGVLTVYITPGLDMMHAGEVNLPFTMHRQATYKITLAKGGEKEDGAPTIAVEPPQIDGVSINISGADLTIHTENDLLDVRDVNALLRFAAENNNNQLSFVNGSGAILTIPTDTQKLPLDASLRIDLSTSFQLSRYGAHFTIGNAADVFDGLEVQQPVSATLRDRFRPQADVGSENSNVFFSLDGSSNLLSQETGNQPAVTPWAVVTPDAVEPAVIRLTPTGTPPADPTITPSAPTLPNSQPTGTPTPAPTPTNTPEPTGSAGRGRSFSVPRSAIARPLRYAQDEIQTLPTQTACYLTLVDIPGSGSYFIPFDTAAETASETASPVGDANPNTGAANLFLPAADAYLPAPSAYLPAPSAYTALPLLPVARRRRHTL